MKLQGKPVHHYGSQIFLPSEYMNPSQLLQVTFTNTALAQINSILLCPTIFQCTQMLLLPQQATTYILTQYLLPYGWPNWNLVFQKICLYVDEYEKWIRIRSHYTFICK